ncbi:hypothetical protein XENOCAPTIV_012802, partial [Xenoophorus captivus]
EAQQALADLQEEASRLRLQSSDWSVQNKDLQEELQQEKEERKKEMEEISEEFNKESAVIVSASVLNPHGLSLMFGLQFSPFLRRERVLLWNVPGSIRCPVTNIHERF